MSFYADVLQGHSILKRKKQRETHNPSDPKIKIAINLPAPQEQ